MPLVPSQLLPVKCTSGRDGTSGSGGAQNGELLDASGLAPGLVRCPIARPTICVSTMQGPGTAASAAGLVGGLGDGAASVLLPAVGQTV